MNILFATSEALPFIKTGGLADVAGALPVSLNNLNQDTRIVLPLYQDIAEKFKLNLEFIGSTIVPLGWRQQYAGLFSCCYNDCIYYFVDNEYYFKRHGLYGHFDDGERFSFFSKAVLELLPLMNFEPNIIHCNDWQTGLIPVYLDCFYREIELYRHIKTVITIHNIEFQGEMDSCVIRDVFGIPENFVNVVEYNKNANMLKAGIERSNKVTTVSPSYADEILLPYYAYKLDGILSSRHYKLKGIVNGIDTVLFNPLRDNSLFQKYSVKSINKRPKNKKGLQELLSLPVSDCPLIGMVTRLTAQKGLDMVCQVIDEILSMDIQMVIIGTGDWKYENFLKEMAKRYPSKLSVIINFSADIAQKIYGSSDLFLMPSKFEPCGLSQLIAMRYGSIPIVRETGGLKDTVLPFNPTDKSGNGFTFKTFNAYDMLDAIKRAVGTFHNKEEWTALIQNAMNGDYSWEASAQKYIDLYNSL